MQALGTIEVVGLVAAIEAADVACKTANVQLVGYELARGGGYVTVKVLGQVSAVQAAMAAASTAAGRISRVVSTLTIPRPNEQIEPLVTNDSTVGVVPATPGAAKAPQSRTLPPAVPKIAETESPAAPKKAETETPAAATTEATDQITITGKTTTRRKTT